MKILLLAGGKSSERDVSMRSGAAIYEALQRLGHTVLAMDPADGRMLAMAEGKFIESGQPAPESTDLTAPEVSAALPVTLASRDFADVELVMIGLHGGMGENGSLQNLLDLAGKKYTGSDMTASAVAMNKAMSKQLFISVGLTTPKWMLYRLTGHTTLESVQQDIIANLKFPVIVKPNDGGSTVGLTKVEAESGLTEALLAAARESLNILVEEYVLGRELTVSVLDGKALPVVEIKPKNPLYDYEAKYTKGKSEYLAPAPISPEQTQDVQKAAMQAYQVLGCAGLTRIDFILGDDHKFYCLEANTLPGMTNLSLAPMAAKCVGMEFDDLVAAIINSALERY